MKPRFSVRAILATTASVALLAGYFVIATAESREQTRIRKHLEALGAYSVGFGQRNAISVAFHDPIRSPDIAQYRNLEVVDFKEATVTAESITNLCGLNYIGFLNFSLSDVRDEHVEMLAKVGSVKVLNLSNTAITDRCVECIANVPGLTWVDVSQSQVTDDGVAELERLRPDLRVDKIWK